MADVTKEQVLSALSGVIEPHLEKDLKSAGVIGDIVIEESGRVIIKVTLAYPAAGYHAQLNDEVVSAVSTIDGVTDVVLNIDTAIASRSVQAGVKLLDGVKNTIAVASGKGGVGKSTVSVNLALALAAEGARVGVLDADIYGPSQPRMLGVSGKPDTKDGKSLEPKENYGVQVMSIGFLIDDETPMIWRGPMVTQALEQLLRDTRWHDLDYLIIDLPPGTGDIQLTLAQKIPVSASVIVTTPQDIALLDARKAYKMFEKVKIPVLGVVENMSTHICSQCNHEEHIFGEGGGKTMAADYAISFLGSLPLAMRIREDADGGRPTVVAEPDGAITESYRAIARNVAAKLSLQQKEYASKFPNIVIENN